MAEQALSEGRLQGVCFVDKGGAMSWPCSVRVLTECSTSDAQGDGNAFLWSMCEH